MSIFQFVWQILAICGLAVALMCGLFAAPWYVLGSILILALTVTWRLMPSRESWVSETGAPFKQDSTATDRDRHPVSPSSQQATHQATELLYRGAHYQPLQSSPQPHGVGPSATLSYRGAPYATEAPGSDQPDEVLHPSVATPELKYRGVKVHTSHQ